MKRLLINIFVVYMMREVKMCPNYADYCTREMRVVLRVVRKEMGVLF